MVRFASSLVIAAACLVGLAALDVRPARAQAPKGPQPVSIGFRNDTTMTVVVRGISLVNNMPRGGQPLLIRSGKTAFDNNVPPGQRRITVIDYNQNRPLLVDFPILVPQGRDLYVLIRVSPADPKRIVLAPDRPLP